MTGLRAYGKKKKKNCVLSPKTTWISGIFFSRLNHRLSPANDINTTGMKYCMTAFHEWMADTTCWACASPTAHAPNGTDELHAFRRSRLFWKNEDMASDMEYSNVTISTDLRLPTAMARAVTPGTVRRRRYGRDVRTRAELSVYEHARRRRKRSPTALPSPPTNCTLAFPFFPHTVPCAIFDNTTTRVAVYDTEDDSEFYRLQQ